MNAQLVTDHAPKPSPAPPDLAAHCCGEAGCRAHIERLEELIRQLSEEVDRLRSLRDADDGEGGWQS